MLPTPEWVYAKLERWHHLSFLKSSTTIEMLERVQKTSTAKKAIGALLHLIDEDLGYELHEQVTATKTTLSSALETELRFGCRRSRFSGTRRATSSSAGWRRTSPPSTPASASCWRATGLPAAAIDTVFLTGGSSFVPSVRRVFERRFPDATISGGHELTSVATGLALRAAR